MKITNVCSGRFFASVAMSSDMADASSVTSDNPVCSRLRNVLKRVVLCRSRQARDGNGEDGDSVRAAGENGRWVIHPLSPVRCCYLMFMVVLTFVNLITIPLDMAFSEDMDDYSHKCWVSFNVFSDIVFCVDIGINFRMGTFSKDGQVPILDPDLIRIDYLRTWFFPDVVAGFPVDIIIIVVEEYCHADTSSLMASKMLRMLMFARILSMIRLLRVPRLLRFCSELEHDIMAAMCSNLLKKGQLFVNRDFNFIEAILMKLEYEFFQEGDIIIHQNSQADCMFFIEYGRVLVETECFQRELYNGDHFGGAELGQQAPSTSDGV